jgi:hypothetical protein
MSFVSHDTIRQLGRDGLSIAEIAEKTGVVRISIDLVLEQAGLPRRAGRIRVNGERAKRYDHQAALAAYAEGSSPRAIAADLGVCAATIRALIAKSKAAA